MQESVNAAMEQISGPAGEQVPTLAEVERKIEAGSPGPRAGQSSRPPRSDPLDVQMLEIEQAQLSAGAQARLTELRARP